MKKWTKARIKKLLACETDKQLQRAFPQLSVDILRRYQRKFTPHRARANIYRAVILPDFHYPLHSEICWRVVQKFLSWFRPHEIVLLGDALELQSIDHWKKEKENVKYFEGKKLLKEYEGFIKEILEPLEKLCPNAKKVYMGGNHEDWAYQLVDKQPQLEGLVEPELAMKLEQRGWSWIPFIQKDKGGNYLRGIYHIGKLTLIHGQYSNIYHAAKTSQAYEKSTVYGHTHDLQMYCKVHTEDPGDWHSAMSIGCLCDKSPSYLWGKPNRWVHAFGVLYVRPDGLFNLYVPVIINGQFVFDGQLFDGN